MIQRMALVAVLACVPALAQFKSEGLVVIFRNGTRLMVHTGTTGQKSPFSTSGTIALGDGEASSHRLVLDRGQPIFGYTIDAWAVANARDLYSIRIRPLDPHYLALLPTDSPGRKTDGPIATVSATREFPGVKIGEAVSIDIMANPATGERIYDVIEPVAQPDPSFRRPATPPDSFSFRSVGVVVNGATVHQAGNSWLIGPAMRVSIPGHGTFVLSQEAVTTPPFLPTGRVEGKVLKFGEGNDWVEIRSKSNILSKSENAVVWVYHLPENDKDPGVSMTSADYATMLVRSPRGKPELDKMIQEARTKLAQMQQVLSPNHPDVRAHQATLERLEKERAAEEKKEE